MRLLIRAAAVLALAGLVWWLIATGLWQFAALVLLGAGLGGVIARPKRPPGYKPVYWSKRDFTI
jgi:hypothetical protein